jgi:predicted nucleic acid-binding protein
MAALVVDTSSWISYFAGRGSARIEPALDEGRVHLPYIVATELASGTLTKKQQAEMAARLALLRPWSAELDHWLRAGRLRADLRAAGVSISAPDAHVAQCALDLDAELLSEDLVFDLIARHAPLKLVRE